MTAKPEFDFHVRAEATISNYDGRGVSASITGPIIGDKLAGRLFGTYRKRDGFYNVVTGNGPRGLRDDNNQDFFSLRGQLLWQPTADVEVRLIADLSKRDEDCCAAVQTIVGTRATTINTLQPGSVASVADPFSRTAYSNRDTHQKIRDVGGSVEVSWKMPFGAQLNSITSLRDFKLVVAQDADFTALDVDYRPGDGRNGVQYRNFSQELRLDGRIGSLNYLIGAFYANEKLDRRDSILFGTDFYRFLDTLIGGRNASLGLTPATSLQPGNGITDRYNQNNDTFAIYTNNTLKLTDRWDVTVGLRYTYDKKSLVTNFQTTGQACQTATANAGILPAAARGAVLGAACLTFENAAFDALSPYTQERSDSALSGTAKTSYHIAPDVMVYASYARGFKAGGFNLDRSQQTVINAGVPNFVPVLDTRFGREDVNSYELGIKSQFFDKALTLNATVFNAITEGFQLNIFLGTSFVVRNLPRVLSKGVEFDFRWRTPVDGLVLDGGVTYAKTEYTKERPNLPEFCQPNETGGVCGAGTALGGLLWRIPGGRLAFAPLWSASGTIAYDRPITSSAKIGLQLSAKYSSDYNQSNVLPPQAQQAAYTLVNGRVTLAKVDNSLSLELWSSNLFDTKYSQVVFNAPLQGSETDPVAIRNYNAFLGSPRTYGVTVRARF